MSNVLDSPLGALALDCASFGFFDAVNNLWMWIAVISTAALSFWRIRASGSPPTFALVGENDDDETSNAEALVAFPEPCSSGAAEEETHVAASSSSSSSCYSLSSSVSSSPMFPDCEGDGVTKGKYTAYYEVDSQRYDDATGRSSMTTKTAGPGTEFFGGGERWCWSWESAWAVRSGGDRARYWCGSQDLTAIDGNVVRLWDESRAGLNLPAKQRRLSCTVR